MWTENVVLDHGCKRYAVCEPYVHTHARMHRQNSQLNTLVWGSLTLAQSIFLINGELSISSPFLITLLTLIFTCKFSITSLLNGKSLSDIMWLNW